MAVYRVNFLLTLRLETQQNIASPKLPPDNFVLINNMTGNARNTEASCWNH